MKKLVVLALMFLSGPAMAGTVYRCVGADGVVNYGSKRAGSNCKAISYTNVAPSRPAAPAAASPSASPAAGVAAPVVPDAAKQVVFQSSPGGAAPIAVKNGSGAKVLRGAVYRYQKDGVTHYTNVRPRGGVGAKMLFSYVESCFACGEARGVNFGTIRLNTAAYTNEIRSASTQFGVEEAIVRAIIHAESAYRANAVSHAGAQGLMQLIPATASRFGVSDPFDPAQNIRGGVKYLAWLLKRYNSNLTLAAAAYNAGEGAVDRNGGVPPYRETQRYVERVGTLADRYRTALAGP